MIFPLSGATEDGLRAHATRLADWLDGPGATADLADIGYTLARRRSHLTHRSAVVAADRAELLAGLRGVASGTAVHSATVDRSGTGDPVFVFSGHGSQWAGMGAWLLDAEPSFRAVMSELAPVFAAEGRGSLHDLLVDDYLDEAGFAEVQPAIFAVQVGLAAVLGDHGIRPAAVMGQSMGEVAAAAVAGALPLADAARVICRRSELMQTRLSGRGATALLELSPGEAERRIAARTGVDIAGYTSTRSTVIAGTRSEVDALVSACESDGIAAHVVPGVGMAIHCRLVEDLLPDLVDALDRLQPSVPEIPFYSTAVESEQLLDAKYWAANLRNPVRLMDAAAAAFDDGLRTFVELSPHPVLVRSLLDTLHDRDGSATVVATLRRDQPEDQTLQGTVAALFCAGAGVDWSRPYPAGQLVDLPTTAWQHQSLWSSETPVSRATDHPLLGIHVDVPGMPRQHVWQSTVDAGEQPWLGDHRLAGSPVLPGSAYCEMVLSAATQAYGVPPERIELSDVDYRRLLPLAEPVTVTTTFTEQADETARVEVLTGSGPTRTVHATATVTIRPGSEDIAMPTCVPLTHYEDQEPASVYEHLRGNDIQHGPAFAGLDTLVTSRDTAYYQVRRPGALPEEKRFGIHPALLDACLHGVAGLLPPDATGFLPVGVGRFQLLRDNPPDPLCCRARLEPDGRQFRAHVEVFDSTGAPAARLADVVFRPIDEVPRLDGLLYTVDWTRSEAAQAAPPPGMRLLPLGPDDTGFATGLRDELTATGGDPAAVVLLDEATTDEAAPAAEGRVTATIDAINELVGNTPESALFLVTRRAWQVEPDEPTDLARGGLDGLMRTLRDEHPRLRPVHVDIDANTTPTAVATELAAETRDTEIALRGGRRYVAALRPVSPDALPPEKVPLVRAGAGYVVTGGTGGLGLLTAQLLSERGAGLLVLNSRSAPGAEARRVLRQLTAEVVLVTGDIAEPGVAGRLVGTLRERGVALRGVVHAAGVLDDALLTDLDAERVHRVWSAKATGAWHLHLATADHDLDWWVAYSSLAAVLGSAGQANYAAANAHVDAIVRWRRANGLPGITVNWGPVAEVGKVRDARFTGIDPLRPAQALAALEELVTRDHPQTVVARLRPAELLGALPHTANSSFFDRIRPPDDHERSTDVAGQVQLRVCQVMGFAREKLPADTPLVHLGLDSLSATRIKNALREDFDVDLPVARLLQGASVRDLAGDLAEHLAPEPRADHRPTPIDRATERARLRTRLAAKRRRAPE